VGPKRPGDFFFFKSNIRSGTDPEISVMEMNLKTKTTYHCIGIPQVSAAEENLELICSNRCMFGNLCL